MKIICLCGPGRVEVEARKVFVRYRPGMRRGWFNVCERCGRRWVALPPRTRPNPADVVARAWREAGYTLDEGSFIDARRALWRKAVRA